MKTSAYFIAACIGLYHSSALAQSNANVTEVELSGVLLRIPREYFSVDLKSLAKKNVGPPSMLRLDSGTLKAEDISFKFWLSDGKPPKTSGVGIAVFWPPDPGRASLSAQDFVVRVYRVTYLSPKEAARIRPYSPLPVLQPDLAEMSNVEGIECRTYRRTAVMRCATTADVDPSISMYSTSLNHFNPWFRMGYFSRADDNLDFGVDFPAVGLRRWPEIVCKTVAMLRSWRVANGPAPPDCSKLPRLAVGEFSKPIDGENPC